MPSSARLYTPHYIRVLLPSARVTSSLRNTSALSFILTLTFTSTKSPYPSFFFFNDTATTEIYTLSLHDALPIYLRPVPQPARAPPDPGHQAVRRRAADARDRAHPANRRAPAAAGRAHGRPRAGDRPADRKSTRLNSSHDQISYAVFCLKKKNKKT